MREASKDLSEKIPGREIYFKWIGEVLK